MKNLQPLSKKQELWHVVILGTLEWKATRLSPTRPSTFLTHNSVSTRLVQVESEVVQSEHECNMLQEEKRTQELNKGKPPGPKWVEKVQSGFSWQSELHRSTVGMLGMMERIFSSRNSQDSPSKVQPALGEPDVVVEAGVGSID